MFHSMRLTRWLMTLTLAITRSLPSLYSPHCQMLTTQLYEALYTAAAATCSSQASELQANNSHFKYTHKHTHFCSGDKWNDGKRKMFLPPFIPKISKEFVFRNPHKRIHFSHSASVCWIRGLLSSPLINDLITRVRLIISAVCCNNPD